MAKQSSTNAAFFKTGGREAASHEPIGDEHGPLRNHPHATKTQGREGQPNFIPGEAPVGQVGRSKRAKR